MPKVQQRQEQNTVSPHKLDQQRNEIYKIKGKFFQNIKFKGQIFIRFILEQSDQMLIEVEDTGIGIKSDNLSKLFQNFSKITDEENQSYNPLGVGLGLQISNELVQLLSPDQSGLMISSEYGKGTKFYFRIKCQNHQAENLSESFQDNFEQQEVESNIAKLTEQYTRFLQTNQTKTKTNKKYSPETSIQHNNYHNQEEAKDNRISSSSFNYNQNKRIESAISLKHQPDQLVSSQFGNLQVSSKTLGIRKSFTSSAEIQLQSVIQQWIDETQNSAPILLVDDSEYALLALQCLFEKIGINSETAISGERAIEKVRYRLGSGSSYKLIFMDIEMVGMDGIETAKEINKIYSQQKIIACSGNCVDKEKLRKWRQFGIIQSIMKPVAKQGLKELILKIYNI